LLRRFGSSDHTPFSCVPHRLAIDRDREACFLQQPRSRQADRAAAEHRDRAAMSGEAQVDGELRVPQDNVTPAPP
jgi:hypothetical protein